MWQQKAEMVSVAGWQHPATDASGQSQQQA
jgi:hypothetical protein